MNKGIIGCIILSLALCFTGCKKDDTEAKSEDNLSSVEIDISELFEQADQISKISTVSRKEILYTIDDKSMMNDLMELLTSVEYTEVDYTFEEETNTGPISKGIQIAIDYDDDSKSSLMYLYNDEGDYAIYTRTTYHPYQSSRKAYQVTDDITYEIREIMNKGEPLDLNKSSD
ncbi:MAG: hypothetical protein K0S47_3418 [Herbinix sp.]|jgi:hypothetical protein|nr:hypothetical protein [Herbinix sp.]